MKRILFSVLSISCLFLSQFAKGQATFRVEADTVIVPPFAGTMNPHDDVTNITGNNLSIKWRVISCDFPPDWLSGSAFGICDAQYCRSNGTSGALWSSSMGGTSYTATYYANAGHDSTSLFDLTMDLTNAANTDTPHYVTISLQDQGAGNYAKTITFRIIKANTGISNITGTSNNVSLYPNPARNEINAVYDASADIKTIAIYNIIGKAMVVYKVNNTSANLNIEALPSGVYFARLMNGEGSVVATKRFTKQ